MQSKLKVKKQQSRVSFPVVGIGASAGGLEAFREILKNLPADTGMAFFLIQHLEPNHKSLLADLLEPVTAMNIKDAIEGERIKPNHIYLLPPDQLMTIEKGKLKLLARKLSPQEHHPIDLFLKSLAKDLKQLALGVVLSGTGNDGTRGLEAIKEEGGLTFAQKPDSTLFPDMPNNTIMSGAVDFILAPNMIGKEIAWIASHPELFEIPKENPKAELSAISELLRSRVHVDFSAYKPSTLQRRISRRMISLKKRNLKAYIAHLKNHPTEIDELFSDFLINVTSFFRDQEIYSLFREQIFPRLIENREPESTIRIWIPACASGEELYSIALFLLNYLEENKLRLRVQMFGTDISEPCLSKARRGLYSDDEIKDIPPDLLKRFFQKVNTGYKIIKSLRDMCLFSRHDVTSDPPFSKIDFISCRNLLIYLTPPLQEKVLATFHYALNPSGFLCLGKSENLGSATPLFEVLNKQAKLFTKKTIREKQSAIPLFRLHSSFRAPMPAPFFLRPEPDFSSEADRMLLERLSPGAVVIDENLEILLFRGRTHPFLRQASGPASLNLLKLCDPSLCPELRRLTKKIKETPDKTCSSVVNFSFDGTTEKIRLELIPVAPNPQITSRCFLVVFNRENSASIKSLPKSKPIKKGQSDQLQILRQENAQLSQELTAAREYQESILREAEASREVSAIAYEELESSNEELQSTNEELQTAKEELQSTNEELVTVNDELEARNLELGHLNNDLTNLLSVIEVAIVMVDHHGRIRRFTPTASKLFHLIPGDIGRPLEDIKIELSGVKLQPFIKEVIDKLSVREIDVQDSHGHWYRLQGRPYRTLDHKIEGAVIALFDINVIKGALIESRNALDQANSIINTINLPILLVDDHFMLKFANQSFLNTFNIKQTDIQNTFLNQFRPNGSAYQIAEQLRNISSSDEPLKLHHKCELPLGKQRELLLSARSLYMPNLDAGNHLLSVEDITELQEVVNERKRLLLSEQEAREEAEQANRTKDLFLATLSHELRTPLTSILMWSQLLKSGRLVPDTRITALDTIEQSARLQAQLIDELLDITRVSSGKVMIKKVLINAQDSLNAALESIRPSADAKQIKIELDCEARNTQILADPSRLKQIFLNLLSNAVKFTPSHGSICIETRNSVERNQPILEISFRDSGKGISSQFISQIFDRFTQADSSRTRAHGGLGLGLFIVRNLAELQDGRVFVSSPGEGKGSTFTVTFPIATSDKQRAQSNFLGSTDPDRAPTHETTSLLGLNLLFVDDQELNRKAIAQGLSSLGAKVRLASSVKEAMTIISKSKFDLIITDLSMPEEDGYELLKKVRLLPPQKGGNTPFVALTAHAGLEDKIQSKSAGFQAHLSKPVDLSELSRTILKLVGTGAIS